MPIPPLHHPEHDDEHDEHHQPQWWVEALKWLLLAAVIGGIVFFFVTVDKDKLTNQVSLLSEVVEQFDYWIGGVADSFTKLFD